MRIAGCGHFATEFEKSLLLHDFLMQFAADLLSSRVYLLTVVEVYWGNNSADSWHPVGLAAAERFSCAQWVRFVSDEWSGRYGHPLGPARPDESFLRSGQGHAEGY